MAGAATGEREALLADGRAVELREFQGNRRTEDEF